MELPPLAEPALVIDQVRKSFSGHVAVKNLSLQVPRGAVYGLLGPNGAGKTTTIRMILDIIAPDAGTISIFGQSNIAGARSIASATSPRNADSTRKCRCDAC